MLGSVGIDSGLPVRLRRSKVVDPEARLRVKPGKDGRVDAQVRRLPEAVDVFVEVVGDPVDLEHGIVFGRNKVDRPLVVQGRAC